MRQTVRTSTHDRPDNKTQDTTAHEEARLGKRRMKLHHKRTHQSATSSAATPPCLRPACEAENNRHDNDARHKANLNITCHTQRRASLKGQAGPIEASPPERCEPCRRRRCKGGLPKPKTALAESCFMALQNDRRHRDCRSLANSDREFRRASTKTRIALTTESSNQGMPTHHGHGAESPEKHHMHPMPIHSRHNEETTLKAAPNALTSMV